MAILSETVILIHVKRTLDKRKRGGRKGDEKRNCLDESQKFESGTQEEQRAKDSTSESA